MGHYYTFRKEGKDTDRWFYASDRSTIPLICRCGEMQLALRLPTISIYDVLRKLTLFAYNFNPSYVPSQEVAAALHDKHLLEANVTVR